MHRKCLLEDMRNQLLPLTHNITQRTALKINKIRLSECEQAKGLVVVIDVIRAFTTAAFAFSGGADKIILTGTVDEAFNLHKRLPGTLLMGEVNGIPIPGFHYGNSPVEISKAPLRGKTLIQRTSSGTQGVVKSRQASHILTASFVVAEASLKYIHQLSPSEITFVITGQSYGGEEDMALADYMESIIRKSTTNPLPFLERVRQSPTGRRFVDDPSSHFPKHDVDAACLINHFPFAMEVVMENGLHIMKPVYQI